MRNNNLLKATITVALSLIVGGTAQASLHNVEATTTPGPFLTLTGNNAAIAPTTCPAGQTAWLSVTAPTATAAPAPSSWPVGSRSFCLTGGAPAAGTPLTVVVPDETNPEAGGIVYALEMFGGATSPKLPSGTATTGAAIQVVGTYASVIFDTYGEGIADAPIRARFDLSDGVFDGNPRLAVSNANFGEITAVSGFKGGDGQKFVSFDIPADKTKSIPTDATVANSDWVVLLYKVKNVTALAEATDTTTFANAVKMTFKATYANLAGDLPIFRPSTVSIAQSKSGISTQIIKESQGQAYISVQTGSNLFTGTVTGTSDCGTTSGTAAGTGGTGAFMNDHTAEIGCVQISLGSGVLGPDATNAFSLSTGSAGVVTDDGTLEITANGQFAASMASPGAVTFGNLNATTVTEDTATFDIKASDITSMLGTCTANCSIKVPIRIKVDDDAATAINVQEDEPTAKLTLAFKDTSFNSAALSAPNDVFLNDKLRSIKEDGKVCTVWNVPDSSNRDIINIRITNGSKASGKLFGKLWAADGTLIKDTFPIVEEIKVKETLFLNANALETAAGTTWKGRAVLEIRSSLSDMEVLAMLRNKKTGSPLNNISLGAHGNSCNTVLQNHGPGF